MLENAADRTIRNTFIFVCDSLRDDFLPQSIAEQGLRLKTIAASLWTASSLPSMVSGVHVPRHGVYSWQHTLAQHRPSLLNVDGYHTSLRVETLWEDMGPTGSGVHDVLGNPPGTALRDLPEPFIHIEHDKGGHGPYGAPFTDYAGGDHQGFYAKHGRTILEELRCQYQQGIARSIDRFTKSLAVLRARGILRDTLVVFTSDHGQLLGEYGGLTNHSAPACPELVYVPTVFIHPEIQPGVLASGLMRHVDLFPTVGGILGVGVPADVNGINVFNTEQLPQYGLNHKAGGFRSMNRQILPMLSAFYIADSVWDSGGGWVFHGLVRSRAVPHFVTRILLRRPGYRFVLESMERRAASRARRFAEAMKHLTTPILKYGNPLLSQGQARRALKAHRDGVSSEGASERELDEQARERLKQLGYIE